MYQESPPGLDLISGVELSCQWGRVGIHVVGLGFQVQAADMKAHLVVLDAARKDRAERIAHRLERAGMHGALEGALAVAGDAQIGRPHFARWMVLAGHVAGVPDGLSGGIERRLPRETSSACSFLVWVDSACGRTIAEKLSPVEE